MTTRQRTFDRDTFEAAKASWSDLGAFPEWKPWRHMAAMEAGIIFAPTGTRWDSWGDEHPSQAAILIRAIRETPDLLSAAIRSPGVRSWGDVIGRLLRQREDWAEDVVRREREWQTVKERRPMARIDSVVSVLADSMGAER